MAKAILLIGSTGNGKSTLGNFLFDPSPENIFKTQFFKTAKENKPETQYVSYKEFKHGDNSLIVIDTPGLNEDEVSDLKHTIQIVENLQKFESILACVFVVKFNSKIDAQYKTTVKYYRKLLPSLFERNVIIVMTDFATDERTVRMREIQEINVEKIKTNTVREIVESGSLLYEPMLFVMDCLPLDEKEREFSLRERDTILQKILSREPFISKDIKIAKTPALERQDNEKVNKYEGEITGYNTRLKQVHAKAEVVLQEIEQKEKVLTEKDKAVQKFNSKLEDLDSSEVVEVASWSVSKSWEFLQKHKVRFDKTTPYKLSSVTRWTNGHCEWKEYEETAYGVKGLIEGEFMRGIYASLSLEAMKKVKYESEISSLKEKVKVEQSERCLLQKELDMIKTHYREHQETISLLEAFIHEKRELIKELASDYLSLEEAQRRLKKLEDTKSRQ